MAKLSKAEQAIEVRRKYQREWAKQNKAKKNAQKLEAVEEYYNSEPDHTLEIISGYLALYNATNDEKIKADANKLLASILPKL